ncbi:MAG TPA: hypothetical protein VJ549_07575 [Geothrix sp.]|nr:hypothetical protein [Geothrix sp.]
MSLSRFVFCGLSVVGILQGQSSVGLGDRQEILFEGRVLRRAAAASGFSPAPEFPEIGQGAMGLNHSDWAWDGAKAYRVGLTEDRRWVASIGTPFMASGGGLRWHWGDSIRLELAQKDTYVLLGAWEESLLFLHIRGASEQKPGTAKDGKALGASQALLRVDLMTGAIANLAEVQRGDDVRVSSLFSDGAFYVFTASGAAIKVGVRIEPWGVDKLSSNFWAEAGLTLCKDTKDYQNPLLFGRAFFHQDGSILIPAQVLLPLSRQDIDQAWARLSNARRMELIREGQWPIPVDKEVGWKDDVCFVKFDPSNATFTQAERSSFVHLTEEKDANFKVRQFRDFDPSMVFTSSKGKIVRLEEVVKPAEIPEKAAEK